MILEEMPLKGVMDFHDLMEFQDLIWDTEWEERAIISSLCFAILFANWFEPCYFSSGENRFALTAKLI